MVREAIEEVAEYDRRMTFEGAITDCYVVSFTSVPKLNGYTGAGEPLAKVMEKYDLSIKRMEPNGFEGVRIWLE